MLQALGMSHGLVEPALFKRMWKRQDENPGQDEPEADAS